MGRKLFEAECGRCRRAGLEGPDTRITGYGDMTGWRHDKATPDKHSPWVTGTMRQIHTRKA